MNEEKSEAYVGLDMSLTGSGVAVKIGETVSLYTVKTNPKTCGDDLARFRHIVNCVMEKIPKGDVKMICIEDVFTPSNPFQIGAAISLAMLGVTMRLALYEAGFPFVVVAASQVKKWATGKGVGQKSMILKEIYRRYGLECSNDNESDAASMMYLAEALVVGVKDDAPKFQREVVETVRSDRPRYNVKESWA